MVHIQPRIHVLDRADFTAPTPQHELDHAHQEYIYPIYLPRNVLDDQVWI